MSPALCRTEGVAGRALGPRGALFGPAGSFEEPFMRSYSFVSPIFVRAWPVIAALWGSTFVAACSCDEEQTALKSAFEVLAAEEAGEFGGEPVANGTTFDFKDVLVSKYGLKKFRLRNSGTGVFKLTAVTLGPECGPAIALGPPKTPASDDPLITGEEKIPAADDELRQQGTIDFLVAFQPDDLKPYTCAVTVETTDAELPKITLNFKGRGTGATVEGIDWGALGVGGFSTNEAKLKKVVLRHNFNNPLKISKLALDDAATASDRFSGFVATDSNSVGLDLNKTQVIDDTITVPAAKGDTDVVTFEIELQFLPTRRGQSTKPEVQTLQIATSSPEKLTLNAPLSGYGVAPELGLVIDPTVPPLTVFGSNPPIVDFGREITGTQSRTFYLVNIGDAGFPLPVTSVAFVNVDAALFDRYEIAAKPADNSNINPVKPQADGTISQADLDASGVITVTYEAALIAQQAAIIVTTQDIFTPELTVGLTAEAPSPALGKSTSNQTHQATVVQPHNFEVTFCNYGDAELTVTGLKLYQLKGSDFVSPPEAGSAAANFAITVQPTTYPLTLAEGATDSVSPQCANATDGTTGFNATVTFTPPTDKGVFDVYLAVESNDPAYPCDDPSVAGFGSDCLVKFTEDNAKAP
jgi:hypothetical protein